MYQCPRGHGTVEPRPPGKYPKCPECYREKGKREAERQRQQGATRKRTRDRVVGLFGNRCSAILDDGSRCFTHGGLEVHHVDGDPGNNHPENLVPVCRPHHHSHAGRPRSAFVDMPEPFIG
jgi:HNH endonuclease